MDQINQQAQPGVGQAPAKSSGALDAFLNLLSLVTLGWFAITLGRLLFGIIEHTIGELPIYLYNRSDLAFNIASVLIVAPVLLGITGYRHKLYRLHRLRPGSGVNRWLTYLMLLITTLAIIGSLIALVYQLVNGEYTTATILKILTVLVIAASIFGYYAYELRRSDYSQRTSLAQGAVALVAVAMLGSIIGGFIVAGSPQQARQFNQDQQRVDALSTLSRAINWEYQQQGQLPETLDAPQFGYQDPVTKASFEYQVLDADHFELCATFELAAAERSKPQPYMPGSDPWYYHDQGRECYQLKAQAKQDPIIEPRPIAAPVQ